MVTDSFLRKELLTVPHSAHVFGERISYSFRKNTGRFVSKTLWPVPTLAIMFPASSIVKQVQNDDENNRFYAQAEVMLAEDLDHAELQLRDLDSSVYAAPLMNAKAGVNTFYISGSGNSPFKIGGTIPVICFLKGEIP